MSSIPSSCRALARRRPRRPRLTPSAGTKENACARSGDPEPAVEERGPPLRGDRARWAIVKEVRMAEEWGHLCRRADREPGPVPEDRKGECLSVFAEHIAIEGPLVGLTGILRARGITPPGSFYSAAMSTRKRSFKRSMRRAWILQTRDSESPVSSPISRIGSSSQYLRYTMRYSCSDSF